MKDTCKECFWQKDCEDIKNCTKYTYDCWKYRNENQKYSFSESSNKDDIINIRNR